MHTNFDVNYYTFETNITQYGQYFDGVTYTEMWDDPGVKLKKDVFDVERNARFIHELYNLFPNMNAVTNDVLYELLVEEDEGLFGVLSYSVGTKHNHHTHFHVELKD